MILPRVFLVSASLILATLCSSCGLISEAGPLKGSIKRTGGSYEVVEVKSASDIPGKSSSYGRAETPPRIKGDAYSDKIRVRDILDIVITDVAENSPFHAAGSFRIGPLEVPGDGRISIPYVGEIQVIDKSLSQAATDLEEKVRPVSQTARVSFNRNGRLPRIANVLGEVNRPGPVPLEREGITSHDLLASAAGPKNAEHLYHYILRRGNREFTFDYLGFRNHPFAVEENDLLTVSTDVSNRFHVMGALIRPTSVAFPIPDPTLADALGVATGLDVTRSDPSGVFVFRKGNPDRVFTFDLKDPAIMGLVQRFPMNGEDIIYVTEAPLVRWNRMLNLILPGQAFQALNVANRYGN